jgi:hypothetical protein
VIVIDKWAGVLLDVAACDENGGPLAIEAEAHRELDALERLIGARLAAPV